MPYRGPRERGAVRFRRRCFAVAIVIAVVSNLEPRIGHVGQITDQVVSKPGGQVQCAGSLCGRGFAPVRVVHVRRQNSRAARVGVNRVGGVEVR